jgi:PKHD-type hydroxylase
MNSNYTFDQPPSDLLSLYSFQQGFSKEELKKIEEDIHTLPWQVASTTGGEKEMRKSNIKWIPQHDNFFWLYERLANMAVEANNRLWKFDLQQIPEQIQYTEYHAPSGHYDWHVDIGSDALSKRKISITVQLSESDEYEGGDLELFRGGSMNGSFIQAERNAGCVFLFPSYIMHRITPVTRGIRKSFVLWLGGSHYR